MWLCKRDLSKECKGKHKSCTDCVLDSIIAEIESDWQLKELPSSPFSCGLRRAIEIIDKYKAESEET
jgi:hypothetical protein